MANDPSPRETQDDLRERALDIGVALIREGGLSQVKARVLAVRLNVSVGTVYNLFGHMDEFIYRLNARSLDGLYDAAAKAVGEARDNHESATVQMLALSRAYLDYVSANMAEWNAVVGFLQRANSTPPDWYREKERRVSGLVEQTIKGMPALSDAEQVRMMSRAMWGAVHGIVTVSLRRGGSGQHKDHVWEQIDFVVRSISRGLQEPQLLAAE